MIKDKIEEKDKCSYPNCEKKANYLVRKSKVFKLQLCDEHYDLWKFIDDLMFNATVEVNLRKSRFELIDND